MPRFLENVPQISSASFKPSSCSQNDETLVSLRPVGMCQESMHQAITEEVRRSDRVESRGAYGTQEAQDLAGSAYPSPASRFPAPGRGEYPEEGTAYTASPVRPTRELFAEHIDIGAGERSEAAPRYRGGAPAVLASSSERYPVGTLMPLMQDHNECESELVRRIRTSFRIGIIAVPMPAPAAPRVLISPKDTAPSKEACVREPQMDRVWTCRNCGAEFGRQKTLAMHSRMCLPQAA